MGRRGCDLSASQTRNLGRYRSPASVDPNAAGPRRALESPTDQERDYNANVPSGWLAAGPPRLRSADRALSAAGWVAFAIDTDAAQQERGSKSARVPARSVQRIFLRRAARSRGCAVRSIDRPGAWFAVGGAIAFDP